jgi:hypothetical protein
MRSFDLGPCKWSSWCLFRPGHLFLSIAHLLLTIFSPVTTVKKMSDAHEEWLRKYGRDTPE